jgi:hypothetical protein
MALEKMEALESRIRSLLELVEDLRRSNAVLHRELRAANERVMEQEAMGRRWEEERIDIRTRIEKVLAELDFLEGIEQSKEVALD